jgi:hypothetical protein
VVNSEILFLEGEIESSNEFTSLILELVHPKSVLFRLLDAIGVGVLPSGRVGGMQATLSIFSLLGAIPLSCIGVVVGTRPSLEDN